VRDGGTPLPSGHAPAVAVIVVVTVYWAKYARPIRTFSRRHDQVGRHTVAYTGTISATVKALSAKAPCLGADGKGRDDQAASQNRSYLWHIEFPWPVRACPHHCADLIRREAARAWGRKPFPRGRRRHAARSRRYRSAHRRSTATGHRSIASASCSPLSYMAYFLEVHATDRRYSSKSACEHFGRYSFQAASKSARVCSKVSAVPWTCGPWCDRG
jgi:hypothetical protein